MFLTYNNKCLCVCDIVPPLVILVALVPTSPPPKQKQKQNRLLHSFKK